jgi:hypothetical protein
MREVAGGGSDQVEIKADETDVGSSSSYTDVLTRISVLGARKTINREETKEDSQEREKERKA